ncbi:hypothetical protein M0R88_10005 [Halorussus gelatinilyticus]|uniref:Uncharacterized protein n=1 Tax=Halorussus gelatinilyticus TaxID=2937524 RepID=A0A8U0IDR5_9EURY|nr:hypothetical protein [Halorussus gelatinilyticus]UPV98865.1 hypothetical protein M0R88_10005 [Halorussus gelatinilyticus]
MPITTDTFEEGSERYSIEERIVQFLHENDRQAYNVREITEAVMETGWSEANVSYAVEDDELMGCIIDVATVSSILDRLVDHGALERRVIDTGDGERSYYRTRAM